MCTERSVIAPWALEQEVRERDRERERERERERGRESLLCLAG